MPNITIEHVECKSCNGTGLYKGMAERDGAAVVCHTCNGTGEVTFTYNYKEFIGRKDKEGVTRVFQGGSGYILSDMNHVFPNGEVIHFSQYDCSYEDWKNGKTPIHVKELYCPYVAYNKGIGNEPIQRCKDDCRLGGRISDCPNWKDKMECWKIFEETQNPVHR